MPWAYKIYDVLVNALFIPFFPLFLVYSLVTGKYRRGLWQRLGFYPASLKEKLQVSPRRLWIHAVSVGEVRVAAALIASLKEILPPDLLFVLSTVTEQGQQIARKKLGDQALCIFFPLDIGWAVGRALRLVSPEAVICLETELWPGFIYRAHRQGSKIILVNGRISTRSFARYQKIRSFMRPVLERFDYLSMIREDDAKRILALGAERHKVVVQGNAKYDLLSQQARPEIKEAMRKRLGITPDDIVFIAGSTHTGEEEIILQAYQFLQRKYPAMLLIVAPRHIERVSEIESLLKKNGWKYTKWSNFAPETKQSVILVDSIGDLFHLYSIGTIIFCGGSLIPYGGHNILEAAIWGKVVFYGPSMRDFLDAKILLESAMAGVEVQDARDIAGKALWFLENPDEQQARGLQGKKAVEANQGTAQKQALLIKEVLEGAGRKEAA